MDQMGRDEPPYSALDQRGGELLLLVCVGLTVKAFLAWDPFQLWASLGLWSTLTLGALLRPKERDG